VLKVNELFYSVKGEGAWIGAPMGFIRLSGCNRSCTGCDTAYRLGFKLEEQDIVDTLVDVLPYTCDRVVLTGGEPLMQDVSKLCELLHARDYKIHLETNGSYCCMKDGTLIGSCFDWICVSPKGTIEECRAALEQADEVKLVSNRLDYFVDCSDLPLWKVPSKQVIYVQPWAKQQFADPDEILRTLAFCKKYPLYRYSTQLHKTIGVR